MSVKNSYIGLKINNFTLGRIGRRRLSAFARIRRLSYRNAEFVCLMRNTIRSIFMTLLPGLLLVSCRDSALETALRLAGENRPELEAVLRHYAADEADSLKYRAARFLIENMPLHYGYGGPGMERFRAYYDSLFCDRTVARQELRRRAARAFDGAGGIRPEFDAATLDRGFLIRHIDHAFEVFGYPWCRDLSFDEFCEKVLPYRIGNEQAEDWMPAYREFLAGTIRSLEEAGADRYAAAKALKDTLRGMDYEVIDETTMKLELRPSDYLRAAGGACPEITCIATYALRSVGLPVDYDYIIQWANRSQTHSWNALRIDTALCCFGMSDPGFGDHFETRAHERMGKAYRRTFRFQPGSLPNRRGALEEGIPSAFLAPFFEDVSELYFDGIDLTVDLTIPAAEKKRFAYLAVFDNHRWVPVAWSRIRRGRATFRRVEKGCAYLAVYYHDGQLRPAADPLTVSKEGVVTVRRPDGGLRAVTLKRKYPVFYNEPFILNRVKNGKFQVADRPDFSDARTVYVTPEVTEIHPYYAELGDSIRFRYIRYLSPPGAFVSMSEIGFYDPSGRKLVGRIIGTEGSYWNLGNDKYKLFDGDPLTYFNAPRESRCWGGMAFDTPQTLGSVMFLPRNDDNFIQAGELYELFCCRDGEFVSLGQRIGDRTHELRYEEVPGNALLLLKNHSKGKDERIFTYEDGRQVWW